MRRQMAAIGAAALCRLAPDDVALLFDPGILSREAGLDILQRQDNLVFAEALGRAAKMSAAQDADDVIEALIACDQPIDLGGQHIAFGGQVSLVGARGLRFGRKHRDQRLEACGIIGKCIGRQRHGGSFADLPGSPPPCKYLTTCLIAQRAGE